MSYWDSSALIKLYVKEADSLIVEHFATSSESAPITSRLAFYEIRTVLERKQLEGALIVGAAQSLYRRLVEDAASGSIRVVEFSPDLAMNFEKVVSRCFQNIPPVFIRSLDGIHLASAIVSGETEFVATDKRLREAAQVLGLSVFP